MKQGKWEVLSIRENRPIIPKLFPRSLRLLSGAEPGQQLPGQVTEIHSRVRYLKGRINTESVLPHAAQTMGRWNRWTWTFCGCWKAEAALWKKKKASFQKNRNGVSSILGWLSLLRAQPYYVYIVSATRNTFNHAQLHMVYMSPSTFENFHCRKT